MSDLSLRVPDELVRAIATETAQLLREDGLAASPWLDTPSAARYLAVPRGRFENIVAAGEIKFSRQGKGHIFHRSWLDAYAERQADDRL